MSLRKFLILTLVCVLVNSEDVKETSELSVTTEKSESKLEVISVMQTDENVDKDFIVVTKEQVDSTQNDTTIINNEVEEDTETEEPPTDSAMSLEDELEKAKLEVKQWAETVNCDTSDLGSFKCAMVKQLVLRFFKQSGGVDLSKLAKRIKNFVKKLEHNDNLDPVLINLIQKYRKFL